MLPIPSFDGLNIASARIPPPSERPKGSTVRSTFGQQVLWLEYNDETNSQASGDENGTNSHSNSSGRHLEAEVLEPYRLQGDEPIDNILKLLDEEDKRLKAGDDLLDRIDETVKLMEDMNHDESASSKNKLSPSQVAMLQFHKTYSKLPSWVDLTQLQLGQQVFCAYAGPMALSLYYRSLVPGFSLPRIASVLEATRYLAPPSTPNQVMARLTDTGAMLAICASNSVDTLLANGEGWKTTLRVRVLHAKVRKSLLANLKWNVSKLGVPINQEDTAATLLAFSMNAMLGIEMILGFPLPRKEQLAYLAYWRYLGWLLGVSTQEDEVVDTSNSDGNSTDLCPLDPCGPGWIVSMPDPMEHAKAVFASIVFHLMHPNEKSVKIAHYLLGVGYGRKRSSADKDAAANTTIMTHNNWFYYRAMQCRRFIGNPLADALELPKHHPQWWTDIWLHIIGYLYLVFMRLYILACLPYSPLRNMLVKLHKRQLHRFIDSYWKEDHSKRMGTDPNKTKDAANGGESKALKAESTSKPVSMCPFAMVSPPNLEDDKLK
ncbi:hypothetical protein MPSEU_000715700 [Mayamaea pseudoterrestris]|nr:hypothetical protein MPSEU_000715700 [Mayamaea pseudoterrestris]